MIFFIIFTQNVHADNVNSNDATAWVNQTGQKFIDALSTSDMDQKFSILDKMFEEDVDIDYMARFVMGRYWKSMDSDQQNQYVELFGRYALSVYKNYPLNIDTTGIDFTITSVSQNQKFTDVTCSVTLPEELATENMKHINLKFKLTQNNNKIKIVDLVLAESSLLTTYRTRFQTMIAELDGEISWFLEDFNDMVVSSEKNAEKKAQY